MSLKLILAAFGLWLFFEGAIYAVAPDSMRKMAAMMSKMPRNQIVMSGLFAAVFGAGLFIIALKAA